MNGNEILSWELEAGQSVLLVGPPGCAKTARVQAVAEAAGRRLVTRRVSLDERVDWGGALVPDQRAGVTRALPLEVLHDLQHTTEPTLLFLDDLGQAPIEVQAALMRLFDSGDLSPSVTVWAATNRQADRAGVCGLCGPLRSRFNSAYRIAAGPGERELAGLTAPLLQPWAAEVDQWTEWAAGAGAAAPVIAYHRFTKGANLYAYSADSNPAARVADYRGWQAVSDRWTAGARSMQLLAAAVGPGPAAQFLAFAQIADGLCSPDQVFADPGGVPVPSEPAALFLVASSCAQAVTLRTVGAFCIWLGRLPRVYSALAGRDAHRRLGAQLGTVPAWRQWFVDNQVLFGLSK